jgi:hypothetical protein
MIDGQRGILMKGKKNRKVNNERQMDKYIEIWTNTQTDLHGEIDRVQVQTDRQRERCL